MWLHRLLEDPRLYRVKTRLLSLGRQPVRDYLMSLEPLPAGSRVLDVASGTGKHAAIFPHVAQYVGIDQSAVYMHYAATRQYRPFLVMDATRLAFPDETFDFVFSVGLYHHLTDDHVIAAARAMKRVTRVGGKVMLIDAVYPGPGNPIGRCLCRMDRGHHVRTADVMAELLVPEGYELTQCNIPRSFPYQRAAFTCRK